MSELRFHPFLNEWVITATHRQDRTFLPPDDYCPLCPTKPGGFPTEVPFEDYDIVVFENKFPSLKEPPPEPAIEGNPLLPVRPSHGLCEVVCYTDEHDKTLATLPYSQVRKLTRVWQDRYTELGESKRVEYVFVFENKGKEIGVTLSHPHGQIYAYPFIPPVPLKELESEKRYFQENGRPLMQDWLDFEMKDGRRIVWQNDTFVAVIPFFARYPYETYIAPRRHLNSLSAMTARDLDGLAEAILQVARRLDGLFRFSMPYIMLMHQQPTVPGFDFNWFHVEFYPPYRTKDKLKYLAGSEAGAGAFINDTLPEEKAEEMRNVVIAAIR